MILPLKKKVPYLLEKMAMSAQPVKRQTIKMVKDSQAIRWQQPANCLRVFDHFLGLGL